MPPTINISRFHRDRYCDESCHLENDQQKVMVLGKRQSRRDGIFIEKEYTIIL